MQSWEFSTYTGDQKVKIGKIGKGKQEKTQTKRPIGSES